MCGVTREGANSQKCVMSYVYDPVPYVLMEKGLIFLQKNQNLSEKIIFGRKGVNNSIILDFHALKFLNDALS